ncbi:MAG: SDR family NAD(P)-dependent oxidoreductase, partial [Acidobacteria bacterium]|nr:SDR family NAD(P)-dependent oxidoreductase [Acidobacteriota bacterium]
MQLQDKVFVISGGGSGLGEASARRLVAGGAKVVLADVNAAAGEQVAADLGASARFHHTDVTDEAAVRGAIALARETFGGLHGAVNCAGVGDPGKVVGKEGAHPLALFEKVIRINLIGTFNVLR